MSRNFGKEVALTAGIDAVTGDAAIIIDGDLQDPMDLILDLLAKWKEGYEVVTAKRVNREGGSLLKRSTAYWFYRFHNRISDEISIPENVGDCRLIDKAVIEAIKMLPERQRFMKGLFSWVGFRTTCVNYVRAPRVTGTSKFTGWKLWNFALEGVTSFSTVPLRLWTYFGLAISLTAFLYAIFIIVKTVSLGIELPEYASLITVVLFLGGIQLISIGVIGEYIGRTYMEVMQRPLYIVRGKYDSNKPSL